MNSLLEPDQPEEASPSRTQAVGTTSLFGFDDDARPSEEPFVLSGSEPTTLADSVRQSGLAWSAGVALFGSVVFMLLIGWGADVLFGSSPWGIVVGIVVGALIGFIQFFRITGQIFKK